MSYKKRMCRDGKVLIEKYYGDVKFDDILENDNEALIESQSDGGKFLVLTDVSEARLDDIPIERFEELFQVVDAHPDKTKGMRLAVHTGLNRYEDFEKLGRYSVCANEKPYSVVLFNVLGTAMTWLGLSDEERGWVERWLKEE